MVKNKIILKIIIFSLLFVFILLISYYSYEIFFKYTIRNFDPAIKENYLFYIPNEVNLYPRAHYPEQVSATWEISNENANYKFSLGKDAWYGGRVRAVILITRHSELNAENFLTEVKKDLSPYFRENVRDAFNNITVEDLMEAKQNENIVPGSGSLYISLNNETKSFISVSSDENGYITGLSLQG